MILEKNWTSPIPVKRWNGDRRQFPGIEAFRSLENFKTAQLSELYASMTDHERISLARLLGRGQRLELELFIRTHGANPLLPPEEELEVKVGVAKADVISLSDEPGADAVKAILDGQLVHVLFQAGEATRFAQGPLFNLKLMAVAADHPDEPDVPKLVAAINETAKELPARVREFLVEGPLGPKQPMLIRAAIRRLISFEMKAGRLSKDQAGARYAEALQNQKLLFFVSRHHGVSQTHDQVLRERFSFFGFDPKNIVTIEQELVPGISVNEEGVPSLLESEEAVDAAGHLYALVQAARTGDFTTYTDSGKPIKPMEMDALGYLMSHGGKYLNIIRINDMDRHTTEIVNAKALHHALSLFAKGYVNAIEGVANPEGQKGGTGTTFGDPDIHVLTETHENSFPVLSRAFETAMKEYLENSGGHHPAYNAMRQIAELEATRNAIRTFGGRIVFVPRSKVINGEMVWYIGVDMPMGDLSLLAGDYKSRMFQFEGPGEKQLLIHDMKKLDQLSMGLRAVLQQVGDPYIVAASRELIERHIEPVEGSVTPPLLYAAPSPELA